MPTDDEEMNIALEDDDLVDDEPIPARRDIRIFHRKKEDDNHKDDDFDEDIFVWFLKNYRRLAWNKNVLNVVYHWTDSYIEWLQNPYLVLDPAKKRKIYAISVRIKSKIKKLFGII